MSNPDPGGESHGRFEIRQVGRILDLLVQELYGNDSHLTIRELVQNAHDAVVMLPPGDPSANSPIVIRVDDLGEKPFIEVEDHGVGMSREDIETKLCVVGDSDKLQSQQLDRLIGKYGIGFLSAFIVADHVEVLTRAQGAKDALIWRTEDKETWKLGPAPANAFNHHGTRVRLYFRDHYSSRHQDRVRDLRVVDGIRKVIHQHCYLIPFPIQVGQVGAGASQMNAHAAPWDSPAEAREASIALFARKNEPLYIHAFAGLTNDQGMRASGVLYFQDEASTLPSVRLHVKRMLVDAEANELLPPYASFAQAVIECPDLQLDLARRRVQNFDAAYRWLRQAVAHQFQIAFVKFAQQRPDDLVALWPKIDSTVIGRLIRQIQGDDEEERELAESFLLAAAPYFPFNVVNVQIGAQGRPIWKSIDEMIGAAPAQRTPGEKVAVYYSESNNPVEKEMLLSSYPEIIDVGRAEREAHRFLLNMLARYNDRFPRFSLERVQASRFIPLSPAEFADWQALALWVHDGLVFTGRSHTVEVERFDPDTTAVVITDAQVDTDVLEQMRQQLEQSRKVPAAEPLIAQLLKVVDGMQTGGGMLTIHVNAQNDLMRRLKSATPLEIAKRGVMSVCWRAVLDYYGWNSSREMLNREKRLTQELILGLLDATEQREELVTAVQDLQEQAERYERRLAAPDWATEGRRDAIIGVLDIEDSVARIIGNAATGPDEAFQYLQLVLEDIREHVETFARVIGYTGDGMQFLIEQTFTGERPDVAVALRGGIAQRLATLADRNREIAKVLRRVQFATPHFRAALAYGPIYVSHRRPPTPDLLGLPAVYATRLCAQRDLYEQHRTTVLATREAINIGPTWGLWKAADFEPVPSPVSLAGIANPVHIFRPA